MSAQDCIDAIQNAAGDLSDADITEIVERLQRKQRELRARNESLSMEDAALQAAEELSRDAEAAALIERRNALINFRRRAEAIEYLKNNWADRLDLGAESFLVGTNVARPGARLSVATSQKELSQAYIAGVLHDLDKSGHLALVTSGTADRDIAAALWQLNQEIPDMSGLPGYAVEVADIFRKWQETARIEANRAGAAIGKLDNYIARQTHDPYKLSAAQFDTWRDFVLPRLDVARTFGEGINVDDYLFEAFKGLVSGVHLKAVTPSGFKGPANLAKRLSQERVLHFKDSDAWYEYNREFGTGSVRESILGGLDRMGESTALMRKLGTNPEANWSMILDEVQETLRDNPEGLRKFTAERRGKLDNRFREIDGTTRIPVSHTGAQVSANFRAIQSMAKLGGATVSAIADLPIAASELRYQGNSFLGSLGEVMQGLVSGRKTEEQREILSSLGVFFDAMRGDVVSRFSADDTLGGKMTRGMRLFFKANGLTWWTDTVRSSAALMMSHNMAVNRGKSFDQLGDLSRALTLYDIDAGRWDLIRSAPETLADGRAYLTTEGIDRIPDERLSDYLASSNETAINTLRDELKSQLRAFITDRASYAVIEPDARTRSILRQGTQPGTIPGELLRFVGQFKAFPFAILQKAVGRELYGRGYQAPAYGKGAFAEFGAAMVSGKGEIAGLAWLMASTTAFGYLAMSAKDLLKGREPRDPSNPDTWVAAMLQGGALGIYGDYLFGEVNRFGGSPIQTAAGPVLGAAEDLISLYHKAKNGDDAAASSLRFVLSNTPFINLFYTRAAMDYLFLYAIQESMNPGYVRRLERRIKKDNDQEFWLKPSSAVGI